MGLADELLEDAHSLADKGITDRRQTLMRRSISTAYYAAFHLFIEDFVEHWEFPDQRARLGRMFGHGKMCTGFTPKDKKNPTPVEQALQDVITAFSQLQKDRERADYDGGWRLVESKRQANPSVQAGDPVLKWKDERSTGGMATPAAEPGGGAG